MPPRALSYARRRARRICEESQTSQLRSVAEQPEIAEIVVLIDISAAFRPLSCNHVKYA